MILQPQSLLQTAKGKMVATIFSPLSNADGRWQPRLLRKKRSENWSADCSKLTALWCLFCASGVQTSHWVAVLNTLGCLHLTSLEFCSLWQIAFCFLSVCQTNRIFPVGNATVVKLTENVSSSFFVDTNSGVPCLCLCCCSFLVQCTVSYDSLHVDVQVGHLHFKGFPPEWCISTIHHA